MPIKKEKKRPPEKFAQNHSVLHVFPQSKITWRVWLDLSTYALTLHLVTFNCSFAKTKTTIPYALCIYIQNHMILIYDVQNQVLPVIDYQTIHYWLLLWLLLPMHPLVNKQCVMEDGHRNQTS